MDISFSSKNPLTRFVYIILAAHILKKKKTSLVFSSKMKQVYITQIAAHIIETLLHLNKNNMRK